jgi:hypothetical protein
MAQAGSERGTSTKHGHPPENAERAATPIRRSATRKVRERTRVRLVQPLGSRRGRQTSWVTHQTSATA